MSISFGCFQYPSLPTPLILLERPPNVEAVFLEPFELFPEPEPVCPGVPARLRLVGSSAQVNSGFNAGKLAARIPTLTSMANQTAKLSWVVQSGSLKMLYCNTVLTRLAAQLKKPKHRVQIRDIFCRALSCRDQISGTGRDAKSTSVAMITQLLNTPISRKMIDE